MQYWQASMFITRHAAVSAVYAHDAKVCQYNMMFKKSKRHSMTELVTLSSVASHLAPLLSNY